MSTDRDALAEDAFEDLVDAVLMDVGEPIFQLDETAKVVASLIAKAEARGATRVREAVERLCNVEWLCATASDDALHPAVPVEHLRAALAASRDTNQAEEAK